MTEWALQAQLEELWPQAGIRIGPETLLLVGREVMTDWAQNDSRTVWNKPSADFLAIDRQGQLVVIELKNRLDTRRQALAAAVQVTAMALALAPTANWANLEQAHHRLLGGTLEGDLTTAWGASFGVPVPAEGHNFVPIRRLLAARSVRAAEAATDEFGSATPAELVALADRLGGGRLANRLRGWLGEAPLLLPLEFLAINESDLDRLPRSG